MRVGLVAEKFCSQVYVRFSEGALMTLGFFCSIELVARVWVVNICFYICDCVFWNSILELVVTNVLHYWIDTTWCQIRKGCQLIIHKKAFTCGQLSTPTLNIEKLNLVFNVLVF